MDKDTREKMKLLVDLFLFLLTCSFSSSCSSPPAHFASEIFEGDDAWIPTHPTSTRDMSSKQGPLEKWPSAPLPLTPAPTPASQDQATFKQPEWKKIVIK